MFAKIKSKIKRISLAGLLALIVAVPVLYYGGLGVLRLTIRATTPVYVALPAPVVRGNAIEAGQGVVEIASVGDFTMTLDTNSLNIALTHYSGRVFNTLSYGGPLPVAARSPLIIRFLGEDSMLYEWDAYTYSIAGSQFEIYEIENGVQFVLHFNEAESMRLLEFIPSRITIERFHEAFVDVLAAQAEAGEITEDEAAQMLNTLMLVYSRDDAAGVYFYMLAGLPPRSLVVLLIELTRQVGYTREDLISDLYELGIPIEFVEPASFSITINHTLTSDGHFLVDIPTVEHVNENPFFTLQNILVYPAFDAAFDETNDGFIFVPDGAGMLMRLDSFDVRRSAFNRPVYNNTLFDQDNLFFRSSFEEDLHMPVFGMWRQNSEGVDSGFFTIIESGAQTAHIGTTLRAAGGPGPAYNAVFASVDTMQFSRVRIFGPYSTDPARFLSTTGALNPHITLRFILYAEGAGYFAFSQDYRQFLIERYGFYVSYDNRPKIFMEFIGAITVLRNIVGLPYSANIPMTTFSQAADIIEGMRDDGIYVTANFRYGLNGGRGNFVGNNASPVRNLGSRADLDRLLALSIPGNEVFMEASLIRFHRPGQRFGARRFQLSDFSGADGVRVSRNWHPDGAFLGGMGYPFSGFVHPSYLPFVVEGFINDASGRFSNIMLPDFGNLPYANYDPRDIVGPYEAQLGILRPTLERLAENFTLVLDNPNKDRLYFARYALNISRESSTIGSFYASIPFRQLVMSGLVEFTTLTVNGAAMPPQYFLLQALELGAIPKFMVFHENTSLLLQEAVSCYFSHEYPLLQNDIRWLAHAYKEAFAQIGTKEIVYHEMLRPGVFVTTYANNVRVYVNYNLFPVRGEGFELDALGFVIVGGSS